MYIYSKIIRIFATENLDYCFIRQLKFYFDMAKWRNFYLQKMGVDGSSNPYPVYESVLQWGIWCKDIPFKLYEGVKEPANRKWYDEHGDDEFIPSDGLRMEAYTMEIEFGCKLMSGVSDGTTTMPTVTDVKEKVSAFLEYLRTSGAMKMYSSYTGIGRQQVRLDSVNDNGKWKNENGQQFLIFKVKLKVNDPITNVTLV